MAAAYGAGVLWVIFKNPWKDSCDILIYDADLY